jgi:hypothetical protein
MTISLPPWALMWLASIAIYAGCKLITWRSAELSNVPAWKQAAWLLAWPGLDAARFLHASAPVGCRRAEWRNGAGKLAAGTILLYGIARLVPARYEYAAGWIGMTGVVLMLHFGVFALLACAWRHFGVDAHPLMNRPLMSASLAEFWGRRWNTAFRDLTHRFLFRPFTKKCGPRAGLLAGFLFSGAVHELVITVPAGGGYGGPTLFFAIQGAAILFERSRLGRRAHLGAGPRGRCFAMAVLVLPLGLLFPRPFVAGIVVPFLRAVGALS